LNPFDDVVDESSSLTLLKPMSIKEAAKLLHKYDDDQSAKTVPRDLLRRALVLAITQHDLAADLAQANETLAEQVRELKGGGR
jgi:hypothetical protein